MDFIEYRIKNPSIYQARKDLINLSSAFNWAIQKEFLISNPCNSVKRIKPPQKLPVFFSESEFEKLICFGRVICVFLRYVTVTNSKLLPSRSREKLLI